MGDDWDDAQAAYDRGEHLEALRGLDPGASKLLEAIFAQQAKDLQWTEDRIKEMDELARLAAIKARGERVMARMNEIFAVLYGDTLAMRYKEREVDDMTMKTIEIYWWDSELEDLITPQPRSYGI